LLKKKEREREREREREQSVPGKCFELGTKGRVAVTVSCCFVPPTSGQIYIDDEEQVPPKCRYSSTRINVSQPKKIFTVTIVKTSDLTITLEPHII
jgi:hypothetical protein